MKIQSFGETSFLVQGEKAKMAFDPAPNFSEKDLDFVTSCCGVDLEKVNAKKHLTIAGEYDISEVLVRSFRADENNIVFKIMLDNISIVHFGQLKSVPNTKFFEPLGENIDIAIVNLSKDFQPNDAKRLIETIDPRMTIFGGDPQFFPKITELTGCQMAEKNPISVTRSSLSDEKTEFFILPV